MSKTVVAFIVVFACGTRSMATDIAFYVGAVNNSDNTGWYDASTQFQDVQTIIAETGHLFHDVRQFDDSQFIEFAAWVDEHTNDGQMDILWLNGCMPSVLYPFPNLQPDGSRIEAWLDGGNMVINVCDWFGYVSYEGGWRHTNNGEWGAANILDLPPGVILYRDNTVLSVTPTGREYLPSLPDPLITYRPVVLSAVQPPWEVAAVFASLGGTDDPLAERWADPVVIHNRDTGAYVAFINQAGGGPATWVDRGRVCAEFITNWVMTRAQKLSPARNPQPPDGATGVTGVLLLGWTAGETAVAHDVYFGADEALVAAADPNSTLYWGRQADTSFPIPEPLQPGGWYFWRVDEVEADGTTIHRGPVWAFSVFSSSVIDDFESYTDVPGHRIEEVWRDGSFNGTGAQVSRGSSPSGGGRAAGSDLGEGQIAEPRSSPSGGGRAAGPHGKQSMLLAYDNTGSPSISEVERQFASEQNWTVGGRNTLSLWFRGDVVSFGEASSGTFTMSAAGADIWGAGDEFRYAYKQLNGDGTIVARVNNVSWSNAWAKAGVMVRESLSPGSAHAFMLVTPDGRRAFQNRPFTNSGTCLSAHSNSGTISLPFWVKLQRQGDRLTGYYSRDGVNWTRQSATENTGWDASPNPQTIRLPARVYVGLALTSHVSGMATTATFSGVKITGSVTGSWQVADIGANHPGNSPDDLYVIVADSQGKTATLVHPDPAAVNMPAWTEWKIPLSSLPGVDLHRVKKMSIGVGGRESTISLGTGRIYIDDIRILKP